MTLSLAQSLILTCEFLQKCSGEGVKGTGVTDESGGLGGMKESLWVSVITSCKHTRNMLTDFSNGFLPEGKTL